MNKFTETIFYKDGSKLEEQINALQILLEKYPNNSKLEEELRLCKAGLYGENEIKYELKKANIGLYVLHDVNIDYFDTNTNEHLKAQIDFIIISPGFMYFVECKNLTGNITVDENGNFYRMNNSNKEGIYNPLRQAKAHIEVFKKIWSTRKTNIIDRTVRYNNLDSWIKPLVVMANSKNILNLKYAPKNIKNYIIKSDQLVDYLKNDLLKIDYGVSKENMEKAAYDIMHYYNKYSENSYIQKYQEIVSNSKIDNKPLDFKDKNTNTNSLKTKLLEFRSTKSKEKNIPPYYIFNNEELDAIISRMPKNIDELRASKILSDIKIKLHGNEIINIINSLS